MAQGKSTQLIIAAVLAIFVYGVVAAMLGTLLPSFNLSGEQNGSVALSQALGLILASLAAGPLVDNKGKKIALLVALLLIALALFGLPNSGGDYDKIRLLMFVLGLGGGTLVTAANMLVSDIDASRRGSVLNFLNLFFGLGGMATPLISSNLLDNDAVKLCYLTAALTAVTLIVHFTTAVPGPTGERGFKMSEVGSLLGNPALWLLSAFLCLYVACEVGVWNWLVKYLITLGMAESAAKNILGWGFAFGLLIGRVVVSRILTKVAAPTVTLWAAVLMTVTTYGMLQSGDPTVAAAAVFLGGMAMAPVFPTTLAMVGDTFTRATATAMGIVITFGWIGLAASSPIIGAVSGADSSNLKNALLLLPACSALMVLVNLVLRPVLSRSKA